MSTYINKYEWFCSRQSRSSFSLVRTAHLAFKHLTFFFSSHILEIICVRLNVAQIFVVHGASGLAGEWQGVWHGRNVSDSQYVTVTADSLPTLTIVKSYNEHRIVLLFPSVNIKVCAQPLTLRLLLMQRRRMLINNTTKKMVVNISSSHISTQFSV